MALMNWKSDRENQSLGFIPQRRRFRTLRKHLHWTLLCIFLLSIFISVIITGVLFAQNDEKNAKKHSLEESLTNDNIRMNTNARTAASMIASVNLNDFDPLSGVFYTVDFLPFLNPKAPGASSDDELPLTCGFVDDLNAGDIAPFFDVNPALSITHNKTGGLNASADGFLTHYPFDVYKVQILIGSFNLAATPDRDTTCDLNITQADLDTPMPFQIALGQQLQGFSATYTLLPSFQTPDDPRSGIVPNNYILELTVKRDGVIKFFAVIMFIVTWALTVIVIVASGQVIMYHSEPRFDLVAANTALLFALPQIRQTQPGIPLTPTISDTVGFYWAIALLGFSTFALITHAIWQSRVERYEQRHNLPSSFGSQGTSSSSIDLKQGLQAAQPTMISFPNPRTGSDIIDDGYADYKAPVGQAGFATLAPNRPPSF